MKRALNIVLGLFLLGTVLPTVSYADDLLKQAFGEAQDWEYASEEEGDDVLGQKSLNIGIGGGGVTAELQGPVISRVAQFMLRLVVILAIPMLLYSGITIMLAAGDEGKLTEALKNIGYVALGVLVALGSVMIVLLIISITNTNLGNI